MRPILLASLCLAASCGTDPIIAENDLASPAPDLAVARDLAQAADLSGPPPDLAGARDLAVAPDLSNPGGGGNCGGFGGFACPPNAFCDILEQCGAADQGGTCKVIPAVCDKNLDPVCGCDGKLYGNDCERQRAAVSRWNKGVCGCAMQCAMGQHCAQCKGGPACIPDGAAC